MHYGLKYPQESKLCSISVIFVDITREGYFKRTQSSSIVSNSGIEFA